MKSINDIFRSKRKRWDSLILMRQSAERQVMECKQCHEIFPVEIMTEHHYVCPACHYYMTMSPMDRIRLICDNDSFKERKCKITYANPIDFPDYETVLTRHREKTGQMDAFVCGTGKIHHIRVAIGVLDGRFLMGSMGTAVGEGITSLVEYAGRKKLPLILFSASGGARMQEGLYSLMQMAKTSAAVERYKREGGLFISCLTNPTTGGVSASYASLGDIIIAEPDALIGFAGPRVIEQTIGQKLPEGFQHAEFLLEHGMIDRIVERKRLRSFLHRVLRIHQM